MSTQKNSDLDKKITKNSNIADLIFRHPEIAEIFLDFGMHCAGCAFSAADTVETGAMIHGLDEDDIADMVKRINEHLETA